MRVASKYDGSHTYALAWSAALGTENAHTRD